MNWLIKLLGGVTATEFAEVFSLAAKDREVMVANNEFIKSQCDLRQQRIDYLENLILTKVGYVITSSESDATGHKEFQPIGGNNTWNQVKRNLELKDHKLMQERKKHAH